MGGGQPIVNDATPGLVVLCSIQEQAEQHPSLSSASAPDSRCLPHLCSCNDFLQGWTMMWRCKSNLLSPSFLAHGVFFTALVTMTATMIAMMMRMSIMLSPHLSASSGKICASGLEPCTWKLTNAMMHPNSYTLNTHAIWVKNSLHNPCE